MIQDIIKNKSQELLKRIVQIFKEDECVICMEDGVDAVYYQCGHQCCHYKCSKELPDKKCPLCRNHIVATIWMGQDEIKQEPVLSLGEQW